MTAIAAVALLLRLWGVRHGLPFVYNLDEGANFVPYAVGFFSGDFNPHYFINPPAFSYLLHAVFAVYFGGGDAAQHAYAVDQATLFTVARAVSAVLGAASVVAIAALARRLYNERVALLAAALLAVAFLPVFYGHLALNDAPALLPILISLYGSAGIVIEGRTRDWLIAAVGLGLATATKYTAAIVLVPLLIAACTRLLVPGARLRTLALLAVAGTVSVALFFVINPYGLLASEEFRTGLATQRSAAGSLQKLGQAESSGIRYYLWTLTWGLGVLPSLAACAGAWLAIRRGWRTGALLTVYPLLFLLYMGLQGRFFGRWLMPILPAVIVLAALAAVALADRLAPAGRRRAWRVAVFACVTAALVGQSLIHSLHVDRVLSRSDTRSVARQWLVEHLPPATKLVIEPVVPQSYIHDPTGPHRATSSGNRWIKYVSAKSTISNSGQKLPPGRVRGVKAEDYEYVVRPALLKDYRAKGFCWLVTGSTQFGRVDVDRGRVPRAAAYYRQLRHLARRRYTVSPYRSGQGPVEFNFDWSFNYYPLAYERPGPEVVVYRLRDCPPGKGRAPSF